MFTYNRIKELMKILVSKTRMVATVLKEVELPKNVSYRRMNIKEYLIAVSLYALIAGLILLAYMPHDEIEITGFVLGIVITFTGFEIGEMGIIGVVSALLLVSTILSIFMPGYATLQILSASYVAGVSFGFLFYYIILFAYGYTTLDDRSVFIPANLTIHEAVMRNFRKTAVRTKAKPAVNKKIKASGGSNGKK
mgnify:CR=1 FL=1